MTPVVAALGMVGAVATAALGCAVDECDDASEARGEIGLGDLGAGYQPMTDGDEVSIVLGPQGLHMIVVSVRVDGLRGVDGDTYRVSVAVEHDGGLVAGTVSDVAPTASTVDAAVYFLGLRVPFTVEEVRPLDGATAIVTATITDGCGEPVVARRSIGLRL